MDADTNNFDINYALAWSADQGGFSSSLAKNMLEYIKKNKIEVKSCLDITCGTGEYLSYFDKNKILCYGTEIAKSMVDYCTDKYPSMKVVLTKDIPAIPFKQKFDLISCNHDMVNNLEKMSDWATLFKNVHNCLNKGGIFTFDYYTKNKLSSWNEVAFEESDIMDHVTNIKKGIDNKTIFNEIYYLKQKNGSYKKTFNIEVKSYFENEEIVEALKKAGFKTIEMCNFSLEKIDDYADRNRIHIIAR